MIFLIDYDPQAGNVVDLLTFSDGEDATAADARLALELSLHRAGIKREVVIIRARDLESLHRTHSRYFTSPSSARDALLAAVTQR